MLDQFLIGVVSIKELSTYLPVSGKKVTLPTETKLVPLKGEWKLHAGSLTTTRKCRELELCKVVTVMILQFFLS